MSRHMRSPGLPRRSEGTKAGSLLAVALLTVAMSGSQPAAQGRPAAASNQKIDEAYTAKIKEFLQDPRITTELVDHLPASDTVPTPLKVLGRVVGQPGELAPGR